MRLNQYYCSVCFVREQHAAIQDSASPTVLRSWFQLKHWVSLLLTITYGRLSVKFTPDAFSNKYSVWLNQTFVIQVQALCHLKTSSNHKNYFSLYSGGQGVYICLPCHEWYSHSLVKNNMTMLSQHFHCNRLIVELLQIYPMSTETWTAPQPSWPVSSEIP